MQRADYQLVAEDYRGSDWWNGLAWEPWSWVELSYGWRDRDRDYDHRLEVTPGGRPIEGTELSFAQVEEQAEISFQWEKWGRWSLGAGWSARENRDEASGFYDYDRSGWNGMIEWRSPQRDWECRVEWEDDDLDYLHQTVGAGLDPAARAQRDRWIRVELWRRINSRWEVQIEFEDLLSESNETDGSYRDQIVWVGFTFNS